MFSAPQVQSLEPRSLKGRFLPLWALPEHRGTARSGVFNQSLHIWNIIAESEEFSSFCGPLGVVGRDPKPVIFPYP